MTHTQGLSKPTWINETVASRGEGGVKEYEVCNGLGTIFLTNLAPAGLQDINLHHPGNM